MQPGADYFFIATISHVEGNVRNNTGINEGGWDGLINNHAVRNDEGVGRKGEKRTRRQKRVRPDERSRVDDGTPNCLRPLSRSKEWNT